MWAEKKRKRPHDWLEGVLGVLGLAPSTYISQIIQKVLKGYMGRKTPSFSSNLKVREREIFIFFILNFI